MATILVDGAQQEVGDKPITMVCHTEGVRCDPDGQVEIGPEQTIARAADLTAEDWDMLRDIPIFAEMFHIVFPNMQMPAKLPQEGLGVRHVAGMILMLLELKDGQQPYMRFPESFLHPSAQSKLADLFIFFSGAGKK